MSWFPLLIKLLCNMQTPATIALLKEQQQKTGAPFIRNYCNLALFIINEEGPYEENLRKWVAEQHDTEIIDFGKMPLTTGTRIFLKSSSHLKKHRSFSSTHLER